jgi:acyl-coenzyme A synthetase/AMP-(fatty) acid ligase
MNTIDALVDTLALRDLANAGRAQRIAIVGPETTVTYAQLEAEVAQRAAELAARGVGQGRVVAIRIPPSRTLICLVLATWRLGATLVLVDHRATQTEVKSWLELAAPEFVLETDRDAATILQLRDDVPFVTTQRAAENAIPFDYALIQFTSGSTGRPKVIARTADSLILESARIDSLSDFIRSDDRVLLLSSLQHSFGLLAGALNALRHGSRLILPRSALPRDLSSGLAQGASVVLGVPFHFRLLSALPRSLRTPDLRLAISGGERLPEQVAHDFRVRFGLSVGQAYGTTETGLLAFQAEAAPGSLGVLLPGIEAQVRDGELCVRLAPSPYLSEDVDDLYRNGWLYTRDLVEFTANARLLRLRGRADSLVVVGGLKIYLAEVEDRLREAPGVRDAVVLQTDQIEAFVATDEGVASDEIMSWCRERMSAFKVPKRFHIARDLPRSATGKTLRNLTALLAATEDIDAAGC